MHTPSFFALIRYRIGDESVRDAPSICAIRCASAAAGRAEPQIEERIRT